MVRTTCLALALAGCGDNLSVTPDARPPDAALPDASAACALPTVACGGTCVNVDSDEANCGDCEVLCHGGESCTGTCTCPAAFVPATLEPSQFDQFQGAGGITVAISPNVNAGINPILVGFTATTPLDTDIDLATVPLGSAPFAAAGYGFDLNTMEIDASYSVTAGTLRLTSACGTEVEGTLTGATFRGVTGGFMNPVVDPEGCTFTVAALAFHIGNTACP